MKWAPPRRRYPFTCLIHVKPCTQTPRFLRCMFCSSRLFVSCSGRILLNSAATLALPATSRSTRMRAASRLRSSSSCSTWSRALSTQGPALQVLPRSGPPQCTVVTVNVLGCFLFNSLSPRFIQLQLLPDAILDSRVTSNESLMPRGALSR